MMKALRMNKPLLSATALLLFASAPALAVEPFTANYQASYMGLTGIGRMTLEPQGEDRSQYTLSIGSGATSSDTSTNLKTRDGQGARHPRPAFSRVVVKENEQKKR